MAWRGPTTKPVTNKAPNPINHGPEMSGMKKEVVENAISPSLIQNRAYNVRRDTDTQKDFSVTLIDIDGTVLNYLDSVISPTVTEAGRQVKVPINYASPERWKAIQKDGVIRDKNGKVQTPAIAFRRSTFQSNDNLTTLNRYLQYPVRKKFSEKNKYDKFSVMNGFNPVQELYSVAMPDHIIVNYEFVVWTDLIEQGNSIVEAIKFSTEDYWGDKKRYKFRTTINDFNFETSTESEQDRSVKATFSMMVYAYLLPNKYENYKSTVQKAFTARKVVFGVSEASLDLRNLTQEELNARAKELMNASSISFTPDFRPEKTQFAGITEISNYSINSGHSNTSTYAATASYVNISGIAGTFNSVNIVGGGTTGSFATNIASDVSSSIFIDSVPIESGNAARWLVSINDGGSNFKTSELVSTWNMTNVKFHSTEVASIGSVPVQLSVNNASGTINVQANVLSGTWSIKMIRMMV